MVFLDKARLITSIFFHSIFFALKAADELISSGDKDANLKAVSEQGMQIDSLWAQLLRGELTQEVKQLRYMIYKVNEEADRYKYIGNGICIKRDVVTRNRDIIYQSQRDVELNSVEAAKMLEGEDQNAIKNYLGAKVKKLINFKFTKMPAYKFANAINKIKVNKRDLEAVVYFSLYTGDNLQSKRTAQFLADTLRMFQERTDIAQRGAFIKHNQLLGAVDSILVETYKCDGEYDGQIYKLLGVYVTDVRPSEKDKYEMEVHFKVYKIEIENKFSLEDVFDKTQQELYDKKAMKSGYALPWEDALYIVHKTKEEKDFKVDFSKIETLKLEELSFSEYTL